MPSSIVATTSTTLHLISIRVKHARSESQMRCPITRRGRSRLVAMHFYSPPLRNVLRRSKVLRPTKLKRIMILNFHFVLILPTTWREIQAPPTMSREVFCQLFEAGPFVSEFNNIVSELSLYGSHTLTISIHKSKTQIIDRTSRNGSKKN